MTNLPKFHLVHDQKKDDWKLQDSSGRTVRRFDTKGDATAGGVLKDAIGGKGGAVRIHKEDGVFQEERTFPRSRDPKSSPG
jgi:hypothetical protein